jgi:hypothetical protein
LWLLVVAPPVGQQRVMLVQVVVVLVVLEQTYPDIH